MSVAIFTRRLGKLEQTARRYAASARAELLALMTDAELEEALAILSENNAKDVNQLPAKEAKRYIDLMTRPYRRHTQWSV